MDLTKDRGQWQSFICTHRRHRQEKMMMYNVCVNTCDVVCMYVYCRYACLNVCLHMHALRWRKLVKNMGANQTIGRAKRGKNR